MSERARGSVDRLAIYTPEGGNPSTFARWATLVAASISVAAFIVVVAVLVVGLIAALVIAAETSSTWLSVLLVLLSVVLLTLLAVCVTGLSIIWKHRGDYEAARSSTTRPL